MGGQATPIVDAGNFSTDVDLGSGSHDVTLQAVDVTGPASPRTFTYDTAGRLTNDGLRTYTWDMPGGSNPPP